MAKRKKDIVIRVEPCDAEIRSFEGGFEWTFTVPIKGQGFRRKRIKMKFESWWLNYLANDLRKALRAEIKELERLQELVGFKNIDQ